MRPKHLKFVGLIALTIATLALVAFAFVKPSVDQDELRRAPATVPLSHTGPTAVPTAAAPPKLPAGVLKPGTRVAFFGDSWTGGYAAAPGKGYANETAASFGWDPVIEAASGTGYLHAADTVTYPVRANSLQPDDTVGLVILQGGLNDEGENIDGLAAAATNTVTELRAAYPKASMVILGPAPATLPVSPALEQIGSTLSMVASRAGVPYISPIQEQWITSANYGAMIDTTKLNHPSTAGHAALAQRLVADLKALAG